MIASLMALIAQTIYNQMYGSSSVLTLMERYNSIAETAMSMNGFSAMILTIKTLALGITTLLYFIDLSGKVTEKNFSTSQFFSATLRLVATYVFIENSDKIVGLLMQVGESVAVDLSDDVGLDFFADEETKVLLVNGLAKMKLTEVLGYIVSSVVPWMMSMIGEVVLQIILISRILEIVVMTTFAPLAISDIYREGTSSPGIQYMKKVLAVGLQVAVILMINAATQAIIANVVNPDGAHTMGATITGYLVEAEITGSRADALSDGSAMYTEESIRNFLDALTGQGYMLKVMGITLARIGLIWNSMPLCEEITGAK